MHEIFSTLFSVAMKITVICLFISGGECLWNGERQKYIVKGLLLAIWLPLMIIFLPTGWQSTVGAIVALLAGGWVLIAGMIAAIKGSHYSGVEVPGGITLVIIGALLMVIAAIKF